MNPLDPTRNQAHDEIDEALLAAAAFGTLAPDEEEALRDLLDRSPGAREELASLQALAGDLALLAEERAPSPELRDRLEAAITQGPEAIAPLPIASAAPLRPEPAPWRIPSGWWLAAAAALVVALAGGVLLDRFVLTDEADPDTIAYQVTTPIPNLTAELTYDPDAQLFVLTTENMPPAPADRVYQVWLIDKEGVAQPSGVIEGSTFAVAANRDAFDAFAITVEPGPLGSAAPSTDPFFVAPLAEASDD